ncbi:MAG: SDR family NAD(P)-dependent oxidoreductase [candidate division NC10 bacterium]|nr:SDR family NAD(P)-dependent oxidoreductase [candidate division NC10 bacterium]
MLLKDKVALVTGAGRGIGKAISLKLAEEGASLILCSRTASQLQEVTAAIRSAGRPCMSGVVDVAKEEEVTRFVKDGLDQFGRIDILVNNAGISKPKPFLETSNADWDENINVNLKGAVFCTRAVLPGMLERGSGTVINIASAAGLRGLPGSIAYTASKAAVIGLSHALAEEVGQRGIRVNVICPGPIKTELLDNSPVKDFVLKNKAHLLPPEDVAGTVVYLASNLSGGLNSQMICVRNSNRW